jgi:hypothetical protein
MRTTCHGGEDRTDFAVAISAAEAEAICVVTPA